LDQRDEDCFGLVSAPLEAPNETEWKGSSRRHRLRQTFAPGCNSTTNRGDTDPLATPTTISSQKPT